MVPEMWTMSVAGLSESKTKLRVDHTFYHRRLRDPRPTGTTAERAFADLYLMTISRNLLNGII